MIGEMVTVVIVGLLACLGGYGYWLALRPYDGAGKSGDAYRGDWSRKPWEEA